MTMAVPDGEGKVKFVGAYDPRYQDQLTDAQKALLASNRDGKPPTYADWLKAQPAEGQDAILGARNGRRYRSTGSLTRSQSKATKAAVRSIPKPLKPSQIKKKKVVVPQGGGKVSAPPSSPPAPAGSAGQELGVPKEGPKP